MPVHINLEGAAVGVFSQQQAWKCKDACMMTDCSLCACECVRESQTAANGIAFNMTFQSSLPRTAVYCYQGVL